MIVSFLSLRQTLKIPECLLESCLFWKDILRNIFPNEFFDISRTFMEPHPISDERLSALKIQNRRKAEDTLGTTMTFVVYFFSIKMNFRILFVRSIFFLGFWTWNTTLDRATFLPYVYATVLRTCKRYKLQTTHAK